MPVLYYTVSPGVLVSLGSPAGLGEQLEETILHWNRTQLVKISHKAKIPHTGDKASLDRCG